MLFISFFVVINLPIMLDYLLQHYMAEDTNVRNKTLQNLYYLQVSLVGYYGLFYLMVGL